MATSSSSALDVSDEGYSWFLSDSQPKHLTASCPSASSPQHMLPAEQPTRANSQHL